MKGLINDGDGVGEGWEDVGGDYGIDCDDGANWNRVFKLNYKV